MMIFFSVFPLQLRDTNSPTQDAVIARQRHVIPAENFSNRTCHGSVMNSNISQALKKSLESNFKICESKISVSDHQVGVRLV